MQQEEIKEYLADFQGGELPKLYPRKIHLPKTDKIISVIGPRRAGKTYLLFQEMNNLINKGIDKKQMIRLNFEDTRLASLKFNEFREVIKIHWQLYPQTLKKKLYIFIDEPQNVNEWERAIRDLHDDGYKIYLTGSSSKILSKEIATSLRGRTISVLVLPFSFEEFLIVNAFNQDINKLSSKDNSVLINLFDSYLDFGGYPEIVLEKEKDVKLKIIEEYFNLVVYRDIIERYNIKNTKVIKWLMKSIASSFSNEFSINKLFLTLKSQGIKVSKNTLYSYLSLLEDSFFSFIVSKFDFSIRKREIISNKVYLCDNAYSKFLDRGGDFGKKLENIVFLELMRRKQSLEEINFWKNVQNEEVDFVVSNSNKVKALYQVCYDLSDIDTKKREMRSLLKAGNELKCKNLIILTYNYENTETIEWFGLKRSISFVPVWKWLLNA
jgi:predicted AAA+ superfamily ATPase